MPLDWSNNKQDHRFVLFADILGFKDKVFSGELGSLYQSMMYFDQAKRELMGIGRSDRLWFEQNQTVLYQFSDSLAIFSYSNDHADALKILLDGNILFQTALRNDIPIKGAISYGEVIVDENSNIFLGKPIIDAYGLEEELFFSGVVLDHYSERKVADLIDYDPPPYEQPYNELGTYKIGAEVYTKNGIVSHQIAHHTEHGHVQESIDELERLKGTASGKGRIYIENSQKVLRNWGFSQ